MLPLRQLEPVSLREPQDCCFAIRDSAYVCALLFVRRGANLLRF